MTSSWRIGGAAALVFTAMGPAEGATDNATDRAHAIVEAFDEQALPRFRSWPVDFAGKADTEMLRGLLPLATTQDRVTILRLIAETHEHDMDWATALVDYRTAIAAATTVEDRLTARLGLGRVLSITSPAEGEIALAAIADTPQAGAAVAQLRARMAMTAGKPKAAMALLGDALARAGRNLDRDTPAMVQSITADMSIAAAQAGDIELAAAYAGSSGLGEDGDHGYAPRLTTSPICDAAAGLLPEDSVIFEVTTFSGEPIRVVPIWSKRPGAAAAIALLGRQVLDWHWDHQPLPTVLGRGIRIQLACNADGALSFRGSVVENEPELSRWLESKGVYGIPQRQGPPEVRTEAIVAALEAAETRYGPQSLQLVPLLIPLVGSQVIGQAAATGHVDRIFAILSQNGVPQPVLAGLQRSRYRTGSREGGDAGNRLQCVLASYPASMQNSPGALYTRYDLASAQLLEGQVPAGMAGLRSLLAVPVAQLPARDPMRRAANYLLANAEDEAKHPAEADRLRRDAGLATELCRFADPPVTSVGLSITEDDYPYILRREGIGGFVEIERRVASDGGMASLRVVYSQPPLLFDAATLRPFTKAHNTVPRRHGRAFACTGNRQPIFWKLADYRPHD